MVQDWIIVMQHWLVCPKQLLHHYNVFRTQRLARSLSWAVVNTSLHVCLLQLHWLPVHWHVLFKLYCFMHSVSHGTCPAYLTNIVEPAGAGCTRSGLCSTSLTEYTLPRLCTMFAECAFSYAGLSAWNGLSENLRTVADPADFRKQLKTHFFTAAYNVYWHLLSWTSFFMFLELL